MRKKLARVTAKIFLKENHQKIAFITTTMSTDLPQENLGELLCRAVTEGWNKGCDPVNFDVVISFS